MPVSIDTVRSVQFGRTFDWELKFDTKSGLTKPFDTWFPASEVDYGITDIEWQSFDTASGTINVPKGKSETSVRITFYDDYKGTIEKWLTNWINSIASFSKGVLPLDECYKKVFINRLNPAPDSRGYKQVLDSKILLISPDGTLTDNKNQNSQAKSFSLDFKILGQ